MDSDELPFFVERSWLRISLFGRRENTCCDMEQLKELNNCWFQGLICVLIAPSVIGKRSSKLGRQEEDPLSQMCMA